MIENGPDNRSNEYLYIMNHIEIKDGIIPSWSLAAKPPGVSNDDNAIRGINNGFKKDTCKWKRS
jgi:hypothetical protein